MIIIIIIILIRILIIVVIVILIITQTLILCPSEGDQAGDHTLGASTLHHINLYNSILLFSILYHSIVYYIHTHVCKYVQGHEPREATVVIVCCVVFAHFAHFSHISDTAGRGSRLPQLFRGSNPLQSSMKSIDSTSTSAGQFASPGAAYPQRF